MQGIAKSSNSISAKAQKLIESITAFWKVETFLSEKCLGSWHTWYASVVSNQKHEQRWKNVVTLHIKSQLSSEYCSETETDENFQKILIAKVTLIASQKEARAWIQKILVALWALEIQCIAIISNYFYTSNSPSFLEPPIVNLWYLYCLYLWT